MTLVYPEFCLSAIGLIPTKPGKRGLSKQYLKEKKAHVDVAAQLENSNSDILRKKEY